MDIERGSSSLVVSQSVSQSAAGPFAVRSPNGRRQKSETELSWLVGPNLNLFVCLLVCLFAHQNACSSQPAVLSLIRSFSRSFVRS